MDDRWFRLGDHGRYPTQAIFKLETTLVSRSETRFMDLCGTGRDIFGCNVLRIFRGRPRRSFPVRQIDGTGGTLQYFRMDSADCVVAQIGLHLQV